MSELQEFRMVHTYVNMELILITMYPISPCVKNTKKSINLLYEREEGNVIFIYLGWWLYVLSRRVVCWILANCML